MKINRLNKINFLSLLQVLIILISSCSQEEGRLIHTLNGEDWLVVGTDPGAGEKKGYYDKNYPFSQAIPAKVPGDIHWDLVRAGKLPDIFIGMNANKTYPYALKEWWYCKKFKISEKRWGKKRIRLHFGGFR